MGVYENIMRGLTEAVEYQQGALDVRETTLTVEDGDVITSESPRPNLRRSYGATVTAGFGRNVPKSVHNG